MSKTCCFTGHRPNKLKGYDPKDNKELLWEIFKVVEDHIDNKGVTTFISGAALGVDTWAAKMILRVKRYSPEIKLILAIPCKNHSSKWNSESQKEWQSIVDQADEVVYVSEEEYKPYLMQKRNEWMCNMSDYIIAVHDGSNGGTGNCVKYAQKK
jgi:uncharacterized phage-like protein YoqJ